MKLFKWFKQKKVDHSLDSEQKMWYNIGVKEKNKGEMIMEKLVEVMNGYVGKEFKSANNKINQVERNQLKADVMDAILHDFESNGFEVGKVDGGVAIVLDNEKLGPITLVFNGVVKNLNYDFDGEVADYAELQAEKEAKAQAKAKAKTKA